MARPNYSWKLPQEIEKRLGVNSYGRQRIIHAEDHLLIVLHVPQKLGSKDRDIEAFLRTPKGSYLCNGREKGENSLKRILLIYREIWDHAEKAYSKITRSQQEFELIQGLLPLHRMATHLYETLQAAHDRVPEDSFLISMRDEAYEIQRAYELLLNDAKLDLDCKIAMNAEAEVEKSKQTLVAQQRLNLLAAVTFPLMAIATLFGMNISHGFENLGPTLFWAILLGAIALGSGLKSWITNKESRPPEEIGL